MQPCPYPNATDLLAIITIRGLPRRTHPKSMDIRPFRPGDEPALRAVFLSAVHDVSSRDYTPRQIQAWAPRQLDPGLWADRMRGIQPFVVEYGDEIVAYADLQANGYIDNFFVSGSYARQGVGTMLMNHIHQAATMRGTTVLTSDVSLTAQPFFEKFGFVVVERKSTLIRGVAVPNALMRKALPLALPQRCETKVQDTRVRHG